MKKNKQMTAGGGYYYSLKPQQLKDKNKVRTGVKVFTLLCVFLIAGGFFFSSYAYYTEQKNLEIINGTVEYPGDLYFTIYVDGAVTYNMPSSTDGYVFSSGTCTNDVTVDWDSDAWSANVHFLTYNNTDNNSTTKCTLNFETLVLATSYITFLYSADSTELAYDGTSGNNLRYIGANPNNYIDIGDNVLWRIIGVFEVDDGSGNTEKRLKVIRSESIGAYSWDTSIDYVNAGFGVNEWSEADLMRLLNDGYTEEDVGGSLYWNSLTGYCYSGYNNETTDCNFSSSGLSTIAQEYFDDAVWNTGANDGTTYTYDNIITSKFYELERSSNTGKICSISGLYSYCNDTVTRTTSWIGKLALMYPSDYGYATSGGSTYDRSTCLATELHNWNSYSDCYSNDWLYTGVDTWTLMPATGSDTSSYIFSINESYIDLNMAAGLYDVLPTGYLSSSVTITDGDGSETTPFVVSL